MTRVLLLVDLQNDYLAARGLDPPAGELVRRSAALLEGCRSAGLAVMHSRTTISATGEDRMPHWRSAGRRVCVAGTPGHETPPELRPRDEPCFDKTFFSAFSNPELGRALEQHSAGELILAGVHLHGCVRATAMDAYERGLRVTIAVDATGGYDGLHAAVSRQWMEDRTIRFATVEQLLAELSAETAPAPAAAAVDADAAAARAAVAGRAWSSTAPRARGEIIERAGEQLEARSGEFADRIVAEVGKPLVYARAEVTRGVALLRAAAGLAPPPPVAGPEAEARRLRLGVVAQITPWNNPLAIPLGKLAPAVMLGNSVVWKPSPKATEVAGELHELLLGAGLPEDLVSIVDGGAAEARAACEAPDVAGVSITGSSAAGYAAQAICARRRIPLQAELGGNNAAIVWSDCDLGAAASAIAEAGFGAAGQRCTANRRVIVAERCHAEFLDSLETATSALPLGDPADLATRVGPLVDAEARRRVAAAIDRAGTDGAELVRPVDSGGPGSLPDRDRFLEPTLVLDPDPRSEIVQAETFGPVIVVQRARDFDHAIALVNGVDQGLVAALFSAAPDLQERFEGEARAGVLKLNRATADVGVEAPFGGWGSSGVGPPEHGASNVDFYTRPQAVYR